MSKEPVSCPKHVYGHKKAGIKHVFILPSFHLLTILQGYFFKKKSNKIPPSNGYNSFYNNIEF